VIKPLADIQIKGFVCGLCQQAPYFYNNIDSWREWLPLVFSYPSDGRWFSYFL